MIFAAETLPGALGARSSQVAGRLSDPILVNKKMGLDDPRTLSTTDNDDNYHLLGHV